jgi:NitT/TauT family transport system substrate-binding protein
LRGQIDALKDFMSSPETAGQPVGMPVAAEWGAAIKTLSAAGLIKASHSPTEYFEPNMIKPELFSKVLAK